MHATLEKLQDRNEACDRPSRKAAEEAVRTLIRWVGEDPGREGLVDTPARVVRAYAEWFDGYEQDPAALLRRTFEEVGGYDGIVVLRDIPFESCCEHHMAAIQGIVHVGYTPRIGWSASRRLRVLSKLSRDGTGCRKD